MHWRIASYIRRSGTLKLAGVRPTSGTESPRIGSCLLLLFPSGKSIQPSQFRQDRLIIGLTIISIVIKCILMSDSLGILLADVSRLMRRSFDQRARSIGVTRPQWRVLTMLIRHEGLNQGAIAELLEVEPITLCRMVDRLAEAGLVERRPDPNDRRAWRLYLTDKARPLLAELRVLADGLFEEALTGISPSEQVQLHTMLETIRSNVSRRAPEVASG